MSATDRPAIRAVGVGKLYEMEPPHRDYPTLGSTIAEWVKRPLQWLRAEPNGQALHSRPFWALRNVSFTVRPGEVLGVIGRNGAGKSTLLRLLSRITEPTEGDIWIRGKSAALLELGMGFHPELSGRENVYLNGAILGIPRKEMQRRFRAIVEYAGIEQFVDMPVKRYSTGMYVRLAFAVAAHLDSDVLIVDEVLSVGDAEFQARCLGTMDQASRSGRTVVFTSHDMDSVRRLCHRCLVLEQGQTVYLGDVEPAIEAYLSLQQSAPPASPAAEPASLLR